MSQAAMMSMESPYATPWVATITGYRQRCSAEIEFWKEVMCPCSCSARRAGSVTSATSVPESALTVQNGMLALGEHQQPVGILLVQIPDSEL